jgi:excisionase family DNA binding protein
MMSSSMSILFRSFFKVTDMADVVGISRTAAYELVKSGQIPSVRIRNAIRVPRGAIVQFVEKVEASASPAQVVGGACEPSGVPGPVGFAEERVEVVAASDPRLVGWSQMPDDGGGVVDGDDSAFTFETVVSRSDGVRRHSPAESDRATEHIGVLPCREHH